MVMMMMMVMVMVMVMNGDDDDDDSKASIFGKAVSHSCHVCLVSSLTVSFLSSPT